MGFGEEHDFSTRVEGVFLEDCGEGAPGLLVVALAQGEPQAEDVLYAVALLGGADPLTDLNVVLRKELDAGALC